MQWTSKPSRPHFVLVGTNPNGSKILRLPHFLGEQLAPRSTGSMAAIWVRVMHSKSKLKEDIGAEVAWRQSSETNTRQKWGVYEGLVG